MLHVGFYGERVCPVLEVKKRNFRHPSVHDTSKDVLVCDVCGPGVTGRFLSH